MPSFSERKTKKKSTKYSNILKKDFGIQASIEPTENLMVCNVGLLTGISETDIVTYFSSFGQIKKVCMIPGKSYSFVTFCNIESSKLCYNSDHEKSSQLNISGPLHLLYVEKLPVIDGLCEDSIITPPGLLIIENFVTESEESVLASMIHFENKDPDKVMKHRSVKHFGFEFNYDTNNVDKNNPSSEGIPKELDFLETRFKEKNLTQIIKWLPDQLTVNSYLPGQGIPPHIDTHSPFQDPILSLSLLSDVVMEFEKCDKTKKTSILLPQRSLLIMSGEARYFWTHGITPRKSDVIKGPNGLSVKQREHRISYTFRKIRYDECKCNYPSVCDSFINKNMKSPSAEGAKIIEEEYVYKVYDVISDHFSLTRHSPWPKVKEFINSFPTGSVLLDIGCGNGKYFGLNKNIFHFGGDTCFKLNKICKERGEVLTFNCLSLPLCDSIADGIICIAVLHHLSNEERRLEALKEIVRVLRPGGRALIYVWAMEQKSSSYISKNDEIGLSSNENVQPVPSVAFINDKDILPVHSNRTQFKHNDLLVPWNIRLKDTKETCHLRYYHVFKEKELDNICLGLGAEITSSYFDDGNWCIEMKKPQR